MKNVIKKISSIAMAFTLLGTGTALTNTISPKSNTAIIAMAGSNAEPWRYNQPKYGEILKYGCRGEKVKWLQSELNLISQNYKYLGKDLKVDGIYGTETKNRVIAFQKYINSVYGYKYLAVDGIYGPKTGEMFDAVIDGGC